MINVDKNGAYTIAKRELEKKKKWPDQLECRQNKYLNNIIEQDHRRVKWKMNHAMRYHDMMHALITITGVEVMHMIRKRQVPLISMKKSAQSARNFIHRLFDIPAPFFPTYMNRKSAF